MLFDLPICNVIIVNILSLFMLRIMAACIITPVKVR